MKKFMIKKNGKYSPYIFSKDFGKKSMENIGNEDIIVEHGSFMWAIISVSPYRFEENLEHLLSTEQAAIEAKSVFDEHHTDLITSIRKVYVL